MVDELELFEDMQDLLRGIVQALGGPKKVGPMFKPELEVDRAAQWIRDRVNADRRERFDPEQILFLFKKAREIGYHAGMRWFAAETGYLAPRPAERDEQKADLQRQFIGAVHRVEQLAARIERLGAEP